MSQKTSSQESKSRSSQKDNASRGVKRNRKRKNNIRSMLVEGEEIVEQAVISDAIYWKAIAVLVIAIAVALTVAIELGVVLAIAAIALFVHATLKKEILFFVLTDRRIFARYGILQVDVVDVRFDKIESIELERMVPGYVLGYASLIIMGTGNRFISIPYVSNGLQIRRSYNQLTLEDDKPQEVVVVDDDGQGRRWTDKLD